MRSDIVLFENEEFGRVRVVEVEGEHYFALKDVLEAQGAKTHTTQAISAIEQGLGDGYVIVVPIKDSLGRDQEAKFISESAVTFLVSRSNTDRGRRCNRWIHTEILPSIRKTGSYSNTPSYQIPQTYAEALMLAGKLEAERAALADKVEKDAPKVKRTEIVEGSSVNISIADMAKILKQDGYDIGRTRLFAWLRENGYLCTKGQERNHPTQKSMDLGLFHVTERVRKHGDEDIPYYVVTVTGKGQTYLTNRFNRMEVQP